jgi:hypothetical protein
MLLRETMTVYYENTAKHINALCVGRMQRFNMLMQVVLGFEKLSTTP